MAPRDRYGCPHPDGGGYGGSIVQGLEVRFAALTHDLGKGTTPWEILPSHRGHEARSVALLDALCERLKVPRRCCALARVVARYHGLVHKVTELAPETVLDLLEGMDAFRRPERFAQALTACEADYRGRTGYEEREYPQAQHLRRVLRAVTALDVGAIAAGAAQPTLIQQTIRKARIQAILRAS